MFEYTWDFSPYLHFAGYSFRIYGLIYAVSFLFAWKLINWQIQRGGGKERDGSWLIFICFVGIWLGGRIGHFGFYETDLFFKNPLIIFDVKRGGIASHGSLAFLTLLLFVFSKVRKTSFVDLLDRMTFANALGAGVVRIGNLFNSEIVGRVTNQNWGVRFPLYDHASRGIAIDLIPLRHPTQIYEAVLGFLILALIFIIDKRAGGEKRSVGLLAGFTWLTYGIGRFVVEFWKEYQTLESSFLTMGQLLSFVPILIGALLLFYSRKTASARFGNRV